MTFVDLASGFVSANLVRHVSATPPVSGLSQLTSEEIVMSRGRVFSFALLLVVSSLVAAKQPDKKAVVADTPEKFDLLVTAIQQEMAPGKRYEYLNSLNRRVVNHSLDQMAAMLNVSGSVDAMSQEDKTRLFSIQEEVNGILAKNADDRVVCTHSPPTGSHIPMTECKTVRDLEQRRNAVRIKQYEMEDTQRALDAPATDGG